MIERITPQRGAGATWIIRPTRSMTWVEAKRWLSVMSLLPLSSGFMFLFFGVPMVLPFAGLEVLALWAAFYYVAWQGEHQEVVSLTDQYVVVEKGRRQLQQRQQFERWWVRVELETTPNRWHASHLRLTSHGQSVELGTFLTESERSALAAALINAIGKTR